MTVFVHLKEYASQIGWRYGIVRVLKGEEEADEESEVVTCC